MKHRIFIAGTMVALLVAAAPAVLAQDDATAATPDASPMVMPAPMPMPAQIDYKVLLNEPFTYDQLQQAKYSGLSDHSIAVIASIAQRTGAPFSEVYDDFMNGETYAALANKYNMNIGDLYDVNNEEQKIADYKQAYETTGWYAARAMQNNMSTSTSMGSAPGVTSDMSSSNPAAMTPPMPAASGDVIGVAMTMPQLSTFVEAVQSAGLTSVLEGTGPFTIFAPNNAAFRHLPKGTLKSLMANPAALMNILEYHVISGQSIDAAAAMSMTSPTSPATMEGATLNVTTNNGKVMINDATVVRADIQATNGIIHVINRVLMPPASTTTTTP